MPWEKLGFNQDTYNHLNLRETHLVYLEIFYPVLLFLLSVKIHEYFTVYHIRKRKDINTLRCIFSAVKE